MLSVLGAIVGVISTVGGMWILWYSTIAEKERKRRGVKADDPEPVALPPRSPAWEKAVSEAKAELEEIDRQELGVYYVAPKRGFLDPKPAHKMAGAITGSSSLYSNAAKRRYDVGKYAVIDHSAYEAMGIEVGEARELSDDPLTGIDGSRALTMAESYEVQLDDLERRYKEYEDTIKKIAASTTNRAELANNIKAIVAARDSMLRNIQHVERKLNRNRGIEALNSGPLDVGIGGRTTLTSADISAMTMQEFARHRGWLLDAAQHKVLDSDT